MTGKMADDPEIPETGKKKLNAKKNLLPEFFINNKYFSVIIILVFNLSAGIKKKTTLQT